MEKIGRKELFKDAIPTPEEVIKLYGETPSSAIGNILDAYMQAAGGDFMRVILPLYSAEIFDLISMAYTYAYVKSKRQERNRRRQTAKGDKAKKEVIS